ncbi:MAG: signal peptidase II [Nannocystaceae bacterium]|nr:signal peptidase II [Myxococcales bacterium]
MSEASAPEKLPPAPPRSGRILATTIAAIIALGLDLWSKQWAWETLRNPREKITVIEKWFYFEFSFNTGSAFGFLEGTSYARPLFIVITVLTVLYMMNMVRTLPTRRLYGFVAIGLIIGGALGNLHDRFFRVIERGDDLVHGVVDFILVYYLPHRRWPTFNVADIALVIGVGLLFPYLLFHSGDPVTEKEGAKDGDPAPAEAE